MKNNSNSPQISTLETQIDGDQRGLQLIKAERRQRNAWTDNDGDGGKSEVTGRRKGKLGLEKGKEEEEKKSLEKMGLEPSLYTLKGNKNLWNSNYTLTRNTGYYNILYDSYN